jgi:hypothetical protein
VRVPEEAASTSAKVSLSFPDWKEREITPAEYEIPIVSNQPEAKR